MPIDNDFISKALENDYDYKPLSLCDRGDLKGMRDLLVGEYGGMYNEEHDAIGKNLYHVQDPVTLKYALPFIAVDEEWFKECAEECEVTVEELKQFLLRPEAAPDHVLSKIDESMSHLEWNYE